MLNIWCWNDEFQSRFNDYYPEVKEIAADKSTTTLKVVENAARGKLTDRNGTVLVESQTLYRVTVEEALCDPESLLTLGQLCREYEVEYGLEFSTGNSELVTRLRELELPGVTVEAVGERVYQTEYAAHKLLPLRFYKYADDTADSCADYARHKA